MMSTPLTVFWFRRDLRLHDNRGLAEALRAGRPVLPVFIFDPVILGRLDADDARVPFIFGALEALQQQLSAAGATLRVLYETPAQAFARLCTEHNVAAVYTNHDYEPYARQRDTDIAGQLAQQGVTFHSFKDQVLFEKSEVTKDDGKPYHVYTPYYKRWRATLRPEHLADAGPHDLTGFAPLPAHPWPTMADMGFTGAPQLLQVPQPEASLIRGYHDTRDLPAVAGTTRLGTHLRFGTVSVRRLAAMADPLSETFVKELCWREFFMQILWHYPNPQQAFKPEYDRIEWRDASVDFERWCAGNTGYPLVDAGMRELNATGFMHNRVRMVAASFLVKHLLIDWRLGEAYFAKKLMDFDLSANNGNWQWVAGCGCDAAPYFRVFNPTLQAARFDPDNKYIRHWVPEAGTSRYAAPMVDHKKATTRCVAAYKRALSKDQLSLFP